jgi:hypothetical protein
MAIGDDLNNAKKNAQDLNKELEHSFLHYLNRRL